MAISTSDYIESALKSSIANAVSATRDKLFTEAVEEFKRRLRVELGTAAIELSNYFSVQRIGTDLIITVKVGDN